jgi:2-C-methyl-D-erythritol 4-phosphate cytidylyltransferase
MSRAWGIIAAAGNSRRMEGQDKIFAPLAGRPLLWYALELFGKCPEVEGMVVVAAADVHPRVRALAAAYDKVTAVVAGGARRQDSCWAGLAAAAARAAGDAKVLIHDAARPLADGALISRVLAALEHADGVVPAIALADTVKEVDGEGRVAATPARERLRAVQTPQGFRLAAIVAAYRQASAQGWEVTDDAAILELAGGSVVAVEGDRRNLKVTYPEDLARAAALLAAAP